MAWSPLESSSSRSSLVSEALFIEVELRLVDVDQHDGAGPVEDERESPEE